MQQERQDRAVGLGDIQRPLQGTPGGVGVAEGILRGRLQDKGLAQRGPAGYRGGAVEDGLKGEGRGPRVALGQPQRGQRGAHLPGFALLVIELGEDLLGAFGRARPDQGLQERRTDLGGERVGPDEPRRLPLGGPEGGQGVFRAAARELEVRPDIPPRIAQYVR